MTDHLNRRAVLSMGAVATTLNLAAMAARADDAPPATPTTPMPAVETYAAPPIVDEIAMSPDGTRCALITQKGDNKVLVHFSTAHPEPAFIDIGPAKIRELIFADNNHVVVVNSVTVSLPDFDGKQEFFLARTLHLDTQQIRTLFASQPGFYGMITGNLQRINVDGEYRVTASNIRMQGYFDRCLFSFGMNSNLGKLMDERSGNTQNWIVTSDGKIHAFCEFDDKTKVWRLHMNTAQPSEQPNFMPVYRVKEALHFPDLIGIGRDGIAAVLRINVSDSEGQYHEIGPNGILGERLDPQGDGRERSALFHPVTRRLAGFAHNDDWLSCDYFDPLLKKVNAGLQTYMGPDYRFYVADRAEDVRKMIVYGENAQDAGTYHLADFSTGEVKVLTTNYPDLPREWITQKTAIRYNAADGLEIHGYLTLPPFKSAKNLPLIVLPHGGPQDRDHIGFDWQTQTLAAHGYAVLQTNFRGSTGYGTAFINAGHGQWGRKMQTDLSDAVRWLAQQGTIDHGRVAIFGASYGGYAALAGATLDAGIYRCAVSIAGISDLQAFLEWEDGFYGTMTSSQILYDKQFMGDPQTYDDLSPAKQATKAYCPILLIHGTDDTVVPIDQSKRMEKALKAAGKPVEFITYKGQDHWETVGSSRVEMMKSALAFLDKHNPA